MNRKEFWLQEIAYNCHQQDFINGKSGEVILKNLMIALKERMIHECQINTLKFLNEEFIKEDGGVKK